MLVLLEQNKSIIWKNGRPAVFREMKLNLPSLFINLAKSLAYTQIAMSPDQLIAKETILLSLKEVDGRRRPILVDCKLRRNN